MTVRNKKKQLTEIYAEFEKQTGEYRKNTVCQRGCSFCCTNVGNVDIVTLEGLVIQEYVSTLSKKTKAGIKKKLLKNKSEKENQNIVKCPFLKDDNSCLIYDIRPFSCRQLYSLEKCNGNGPVIHRQAVEMAKETVKAIQKLDNTGYSGHISYILYMLNMPEFKKLYLSGGFDPTQIIDFGKEHGILINRIVSEKP